MSSILITVFTPTFNRAYILHKLYQSLLKQTYKNFEWLIIDDGSTDNTMDVVHSYINENRISIRYIKQLNGGKHRAINRATQLANGELFFIVDSDDFLLENSLEHIVYYYNPIRNNPLYAGVGGLHCFPNGKELVGRNTSWDTFDLMWPPKNSRYIIGDVALVYRTDVLKEFPFDDIAGENFCAESLILNRIGNKYITRMFNKCIYVAEYLQDGLSFASIRNRMNSPNYAIMIYKESLLFNISLIDKIKCHVNYWRFFLCIKSVSINKGIHDVGLISLILFFVPGLLCHLKDLMHGNVNLEKLNK